jgi:hypothetical protein
MHDPSPRHETLGIKRGSRHAGIPLTEMHMIARGHVAGRGAINGSMMKGCVTVYAYVF